MRFAAAVSHVQLYLYAYISVHCKVIKIDGSGTCVKCTLLGTTNILLSIRNPGHLGRSENETKKSLQSKFRAADDIEDVFAERQIGQRIHGICDILKLRKSGVNSVKVLPVVAIL